VSRVSSLLKSLNHDRRQAKALELKAMREESRWVGLRLEPMQALGKKCELARLKRNSFEPMNSFGLEADSLD
jgi:hypothetical protein